MLDSVAEKRIMHPAPLRKSEVALLFNNLSGQSVWALECTDS